MPNDMSARRRGGGGAARRAGRTAPGPQAAKAITRAIPDVDILSSEAMELIEAQAERLLEEIGVAFPDNPGALQRWREAGADVDGDRVRLPKGLARHLCSTAPSVFTQLARNPDRSVRIGGRDLVLAPVYGPPFVRDAGTRRYATIEDFRGFVKLAYLSSGLHHSGGTICEPTDVPVSKRHLDMLLAHMTLSDKPFMGSVTEPSRAADSVAMAEILFGADVVAAHPVMVSLINVNSPLTFDATMMGALEVYAAAGQACIVSPFVVGGAMSPVTVAGTLVQVLAEVMVGAAYAQLVRPGAPIIAGAFVTAIDMGSGSPIFGTPEAAQITYGAGQLIRRLGLPYRSAGAFNGAKLPDAQAAFETANSLQAGLHGGVNFMLHAAGWLEGGLVASMEKFVMDADQLTAMGRLAAGIAVDDGTLAWEAFTEVGPGGHYLGCAHTQARFRDAFWRSELLDYSPFETWAENGAQDTDALARARVRRMLEAYTPPPLDQGIAEGLADFVALRKETLPDTLE